MKSIKQIIEETLAADRQSDGTNHDERYLYGRFAGFYKGNKFQGFQSWDDGVKLLTCEDFPEATGCCTSCHSFYALYEMDLVEMPDGKWAWLCCGVRSKLFPRDPSEPVTDVEKLILKIFGEPDDTTDSLSLQKEHRS